MIIFHIKSYELFENLTTSTTFLCYFRFIHTLLVICQSIITSSDSLLFRCHFARALDNILRCENNCALKTKLQSNKILSLSNYRFSMYQQPAVYSTNSRQPRVCVCNTWIIGASDHFKDYRNDCVRGADSRDNFYVNGCDCQSYYLAAY